MKTMSLIGSIAEVETLLKVLVLFSAVGSLPAVPADEGDGSGGHEPARIAERLATQVEVPGRRLDAGDTDASERETAAAEETGARDARTPEDAQEAAPRSLPGRVAVDEDEAERALERSLVQAGGLLLRPGRWELAPGLHYVRREAAAPLSINRNGTTAVLQRERNVDALTGDLALRLGLPFDSQLEAGIPYHWRRVEEALKEGFAPVSTTSATGTGLGNLRLGLAKTLLREAGWWPDVIGRLQWQSRTGPARDGGVPIANDFHRLQTSLTAIKRQDPLVFIGGLEHEHGFERGAVQPGAGLTLTFGAFVALSPRTSMRFVLAQTFREEIEAGGEAVPGSDRRMTVLTVGGSSLLAKGVLLNLAVDIGLTGDAADYAVRLTVPVRFDGPRL